MLILCSQDGWPCPGNSFLPHPLIGRIICLVRGPYIPRSTQSLGGRGGDASMGCRTGGGNGHWATPHGVRSKDTRGGEDKTDRGGEEQSGANSGKMTGVRGCSAQGLAEPPTQTVFPGASAPWTESGWISTGPGSVLVAVQRSGYSKTGGRAVWRAPWGLRWHWVQWYVQSVTLLSTQ